MATTILTRLPSPRMAKAELTHLERLVINMDTAAVQHSAYCAALSDAGADVIVLPALDDHPDCTFIEDVLVSLPELSILTLPGAVSRRGEVAVIEVALPADRPVMRISPPGTLDGGDVLAIGRTLFVGRSSRTNDFAIGQMAEIVAPFGYKVVGVNVQGALHLKTSVTALAPDLLLLNPDWADMEAFAGYRHIMVTPDEPFAGNSMTVGRQIFMQSAHATTAKRVGAAGFDVALIDISEFAKAEAGLTCMSVIVAHQTPSPNGT